MSLTWCNLCHITARKTIFSFSKYSEKIVFKKLALEYYLPYITRRDGISFFQKYDLVVYIKKGKMIFSKKSKETWKYVFFKCFEKTVFPKKLLWNAIFFVMSGKVAFVFSWKCQFLFRWKMKDGFTQKSHENMILSVYMYNCYQYDITLLPRKSNIMFSQKNTLKVEICGITEKDDIYPRKYGIFIEIPYRQTF